jgi:alkylation response protein AidB-like acyl-CoA dehydrogenase
MDFNDTNDEAAYRAGVRHFLEANAKPKKLGQVEISKRLSPADLLAAAKSWQALKASNGYACITWSKEWGGPGGSPMQSVIFAQEEERYDLPVGIFQVGLGMCVPTVIALADEAAKQRFVGPALRGEEIWCQLFSEPAAGSDLAGVRTSAVADDDHWIINGQKVWTTNAHLADFGLLLARTDPNVPKHKGLTMFWVDMRDPGTEVRPIHQISGKSSFNEVFFTDLRIPDSRRLGEVGGGWKAALVTLMNERLAIGGAKGADYLEIMELARQLRSANGTMLQDGGFRQRLADWYIHAEGIKLTRFRAMTALSRGQTPGPESSIGKLVNANQLQDLSNYAIELMEEFGIIDDKELAPMAAVFQQGFLKAPGSRVAGGTDEILRNVIAERVLGLPTEIRQDKEVAFKDLPIGRS